MDVAVPKGKGTENEEGKDCGKDGKRKEFRPYEEVALKCKITAFMI
jgi:hypothetical protein